ncbi:S8 family serine peptidase [candidate division WOR-3 bacterium]|nr:S8 family serine peptidase [candidate division WOR-3 bacterium]
MYRKVAISIILLAALTMAQEESYLPDEILVFFKNGVVTLAPGQIQGGIAVIQGSDSLMMYLNTLGIQVVSKIFPDFSSDDTLVTLEDGAIVKIPDFARVFKITVPQTVNIPVACSLLSTFAEIIYAEPNYIFHVEATPNDQYFPQQWSLDQPSDCDIDATQAWDIETGNYNIKIGIHDIGVQYSHEDLGNGFGAGYKVHGGYDFYHDDPYPDGSWGSYFPHGTWVAGIASALTNNSSIGVAGISGGWGGTDIGCSIYAYEIGSPMQIDEVAAVNSIVKAALPIQQNGHGVHIQNHSWGDYCYSELLRSAVITAYKCGRTFVASKGNRNAFTSSHYPSDYDAHCVLSVGATNRYDQRWVVSQNQGSNYGGGIDVVAPGAEILNTAWARPTAHRPKYDTASGTSAAAPHVAGLAGLIASRAYEKGISLQPEEIEGIIRTTAEDVNAAQYPGYDDYLGAGRINAYDALYYFNSPNSIRRYTTYALTNQWLGNYPLWLIGIPNLPDDQYRVDIYEVHSNYFYLPTDTLKFLGIWGLGRLTTGCFFSYQQMPHYGEGWCAVERLPGGQYKAKTHVYFVWTLDWQPVGWFPTNPENVIFKYSIFSVNVVPPYNLRAENITTNSLTLRWNYDYPALVDGFTVKRDGVVVGNPPNTQLYWHDSGLEPGHLYHYEVMARKGGIFSSPATLDVSTNPTDMIAESDYPKMSAFNSNRKVARGSDGKIHVLYNDDAYIYYSYSSDNGNTFQAWEIIPELGGTYQCFDTIPSLQLDNSGTPWVVSSVHYFPNPNDKWLEYYLHERTAQGWYVSYDEIWQKRYLGSQPPDILHPTSFTITGDSGFIAFRDQNLHVTVSSFPLGLYTNYAATQISDFDPFSSGYPAIGSDPAGRIVVVKKGDPPQILWRSLGSSTWTEVTGLPSHIGCDGNPSLWVDNNEINIAFEGWYIGATGYECGLVFLRFTWSSGTNNYVMHPLQLVTTETDWSPNAMEGHSYLASRDIVLWKYQDNIWYSRQSGDVWTEAINVSNTSYSSTYPQGLTFWLATKQKLFVMWTEIVGEDCYLMRKVITVPSAEPPKEAQGIESQFTGPFSFETTQQNPVRGLLRMKFGSPDERIVRIGIYDITGRLVRTAFDGRAQIGENEVRINKKSLPAGSYFIKTEAEDYQDTRKIVFLH